jgi:hypothetical protein
MQVNWRSQWECHGRRLVGWGLVILVCLGAWLRESTRSLSPEEGPIWMMDAGLLGVLQGGDAAYFGAASQLRLQYWGDTLGSGGRPLYHYPYGRLVGWWHGLQRLNPESRMVPMLMAHYYSHSQYLPDVRLLLDAMVPMIQEDRRQGWWLAIQASYLAKHRLGDVALAIDFADRAMAMSHDGTPWWVRQMPALLRGSSGEWEDAVTMARALLETEGMPERERDFMLHFLAAQLQKIKQRGLMPSSP